jgi:hypothetical protein
MAMIAVRLAVVGHRSSACLFHDTEYHALDLERLASI